MRTIKELSAHTKAGKAIIEKYNYIQGRTLDSVYGKYSAEKKASFDEVREEAEELSEEHPILGFHICSANVYQFTIGFVEENSINHFYTVHYYTKDTHYIVYGAYRDDLLFL